MPEIEEATSVINESGNSFHCKAMNYFNDKGWHTLVSPYYMDSSSNKPREIDLIAEKAWPFNDGFHQRGTINIKLFIECKYIPQTNVFWFSNKDMLSTKEMLTSNISGSVRNRPAETHYLTTNPKVAKLFASKSRSNVENEVMYKALNQSLNAMVYLRHRESIIPERSGQHSNILVTVEMPAILCNSFDKFYRVDMETSDDPTPIQDNFQLEVNYAYKNHDGSHRDEFFLIDVVDFNKLDPFLDLMESDIQAIFQIVE